jgi:4-aminobutyrate--pyruvate transaminase
VSKVFEQRLKALGDHPLVGEANGVGLIGAVELTPDKKTKRNFDPAKAVGARCGQFCQDEGIIVRALLHDRIALCPPLVISEAEIGEMFDRLTRALDKTLDWAKRERLL